MSFSEVATVKKEWNGLRAEIYTTAVPGGYKVCGQYWCDVWHDQPYIHHQPATGLVGGKIVEADDVDAEVERVTQLAHDTAYKVARIDAAREHERLWLQEVERRRQRGL